MIQVTLVKSKKEFINFGPLVEDLAAARTLVKLLDWLHEHHQLPNKLRFYSKNTEIRATDGTETWNYWDQDPTSNSDGVWM